jgi:hypothetical protein
MRMLYTSAAGPQRCLWGDQNARLVLRPPCSPEGVVCTLHHNCLALALSVLSTSGVSYRRGVVPAVAAGLLPWQAWRMLQPLALARAAAGDNTLSWKRRQLTGSVKAKLSRCQAVAAIPSVNLSLGIDKHIPCVSTRSPMSGPMCRNPFKGNDFAG